MVYPAADVTLISQLFFEFAASDKFLLRKLIEYL